MGRHHSGGAAPAGATSTAVSLVVSVQPDVGTAVDIATLEEIARRAVSMEMPGRAVEIALILARDDTLRRLNAQYRDVDQPTDVLAFPQAEPTRLPFVSPPGGVLHLGDIVISYPRVLHQAAQHGHGQARELAYLFLHGLLHLLGYDHVNEHDYARMRRAEEGVLEHLGLGRSTSPQEIPH